ncbi:MAG: hypothetical protein EOO04_03170 [Chitinophagaceae bacterium]|nr:MAG: hypothetical protein EOO04_03170 [Chitinophagaceae bacterium]
MVDQFFTALRKFLHIAALLILAITLHAQPRQYAFNRLSVKEGLASNFVYSIFQDKKGFMWFGTANGLQRYDGRKIVRFRPPPGSQDYLPPVSISQMLDDESGNIWVRTNREVGIFDPATFRFIKAIVKLEKQPDPRATYELWQNRKGQVFLLVTKVGLLAYDSTNNTFSLQHPQTVTTPAGWSILSVTEDPVTGYYWLGCDTGLLIFNPVTRKQTSSDLHKTLFKNPVSKLAMNVVFIDSKRRLWMTTWNAKARMEGVAAYNLASDQFETDTTGLSRNVHDYAEFRGFTEHSSGSLWAYGQMRLFTLDPQTHGFRYIRDDHQSDYGIMFDRIYTMYEDKEKNLWLGTDQGVYAVNPASVAFSSIRAFANNKPVDISVTSFLDSEDKLYVTTWNKGLITYDLNFTETPNPVNKTAPGNDGNFLMQWTIHQQPDGGNIWIGCQSGRIIVYNPETGISKFFNPAAFEDKSIRQIIGDKQGNIWFASQYGHIYKWNSVTGNLDNLERELESVANLGTIIYKLFIDNKGHLWAGTHEFGLFKLDAQSGRVVTNFTTASGAGKSLYANTVTDILPYQDSLLLVASGALNFLNINTGNIRHVSANEGLPSNTINSIAFDRQGSLWISLLSGLCRYNISKHIFTSYSEGDGLIHDNFQINADHGLSNGAMLFGTTHDFVTFQPEKMVSVRTPPDVTITDFKLFNTYLPPDSILKLNEVSLNYTQNSVTIEFASLSFLQKDQIVYYYKLEGIDKDWFRTDRSLLANYTQLPPGDYTFKVWCESGDGMRSKGITSLNIHISPPFWKTWWFMLLMGLLAAGLVYLVHRLKVDRLLEMEKVRRRIARDLHDDMGSTLSTINILSEMAKMKVDNDTGKTREYIGKISDNSSRMMEAMDDIVWSINPMNDSMQKVAARMREFATGVLEAKNIEYRFQVDEEVHNLKLDMEARRDLFLLFKEAVNNLAKYSGTAWAEIEIRVIKSTLMMRIADTGVGFDMSEADSGNGLANMKKRAQSLKGKLSINSSANNGTTIILEAPVK